MKRISRFLLAAIIVLTIGYYIHGTRAQILASVWHWRHGYSTRVGDCEVPVPDHWLLHTDENPNMATLTNTQIVKTSDPLSAVTTIGIMVPVGSRPVRDLDSWASFTRQWRERKGLTDMEEKTIWAGSDRFVCLGGHEFRDVVHFSQTDLITLECQSTLPVVVFFTGNKVVLPEFYSIAAQIRKRY